MLRSRLIAVLLIELTSALTVIAGPRLFVDLEAKAHPLQKRFCCGWVFHNQE